MEKKTSNTYGGISKSVLDRLNRNFQAEPVKDMNRIDEIMSVFIQGEANSIDSILNDSNQMLNFKDQLNQTLIHAIIKNESPNITEEKKLSIIRKLVDNKNVSIHTMNNLDQNPLHLACQKGYSLIISYMIENGCDQELIDTYGNTPIHYLVEKFIRDCGENDFYSQTNKQLKLSNTQDFKKVNKILKNQSLLTFFKLFGLFDDSHSLDVGGKGKIITNALKNFISNKVQGSIQDFYSLIDDKMKKINEIFGDFNISQEIKLEKAKKILFTTSDEVFKIYNIDVESTNIVWNDFLLNQKLTITNKKENLKKSIYKDIEKIKNHIGQKILNVLKNEIIEKIYLHLSKFTSGVFFLYYMIETLGNEDKMKSTKNKDIDIDIDIMFLSNNKKGKLEPIYKNEINLANLKPINQNELDKLIEISGDIPDLMNNLFKDNFKIFLNGIGNINNLDTINVEDGNFYVDENINKYEFHYNDIDHDDYTTIIEGDWKDASGNTYYSFVIPNEIDYDSKKTHINAFKQEIKQIPSKKKLNENTQLALWENKFEMKNKKFIYSPIIILVSTIIEIIINIQLNLDNLQKKTDLDFIYSLQKFYLFDIKYLSELCFKIFNNIVILEKYLSDTNIDNINRMSKKFNNIVNQLTFAPELNNGIKNIFSKFKYVANKTTMSKEFISNISNIERYREIFNGLYDANGEVLDTLGNITQKINEYFSYDQLEKYNEYLSEYIKLGTKPVDKLIPNTIFNNYSFKIKYPIKYKEYKQQYFKIQEKINLYNKGEEDLRSIMNPDNTIKLDKLDEFLTNPNYKKNLIEQNFPYSNTYDFNMFYLDKTKKYTYWNVEINNKNILRISFKQIIIQNKTYPITNYSSSSNNFSRGYDLLDKDENGTLNNIAGIIGKEEKKTLCNINFIEKYSSTNSSNKSVNENSNSIVSWTIFNDYKITNIDKFNTYISTNNINELVNMLVYMIYKTIEPQNISNVFFQLDELNFINKAKETVKIPIGIDLTNVGLDETTKSDTIETLGFISLNNEKRKEYLLDNVKMFVKTIVYEEINIQIFKIMDEIKIKKKDGIEDKILSSKTIDIDTFNKELREIEVKYQNDFWSHKLGEYIRDLDISYTLEFQEIMKLTNTNTDMSKLSQLGKDKIIGSKCLDIQKTNELMKINKINYKVLDSNGNTILIRLIEQFNLYGIKKILEEKKLLSTYKNKNLETPIDYLFNLMKNIQLDYNTNNIKQRLDRYSIALDNTIKSSKEFAELELSNSTNLVSQIILNSIYLFNETMWLKIYSYPLGWSAEDKNNLKMLLGFKEEKLLINTLDDNDKLEYLEQIKQTTKNKMSEYVKRLENEIMELENKSKSLKTETEDDIIKLSSIDIDEKIKEKQKLVDKYVELENNIDGIPEISINQIKNTMDKYSSLLLNTNNLSIQWVEYKKLVNELDDKYFKIISVLDSKCETIPSISNHLIKIFNSSIVNGNYIELIGKYFKSIFGPTFNDYWDLDRYDDSEYNTLNNSIIQILKINVVGIIKNETINTLINYIIQLNKNKDKISKIIELLKSDEDLNQSIQIYLTQSLIIKLGLFNPDKPNPQIILDEQKTTTTNIINKIVRGQLDDVATKEINKILEFNKFICENIGFNCYEEIIKILYDGKKLSLYYEIYEELDNVLN